MKSSYSVEVYDESSTYTSTEDPFVIIGGDGSLNYFINKFNFNFTPKVIYIPMGTANDFAKSIFGSMPQLDALRVDRILKRNTSIEVPIMKLNDRYFINVATCGAPAEITEDSDSGMKKTIGQLSYYLSGLKKLFSDNVIKVSVELDGETKDINTCGFVVSQGLYAGGGIRVNPSYTSSFGEDFSFLSCNDGNMFSSIQAISELTFNDEIDARDEIEVHYLTELKVKSDKNISVKLDGEWYESSTLEFSKSNKKVSFLIY